MTQQAFLNALCTLLPAFQTHWEDEDNYYVSDRGEFNCHNVCSALAHFYIDHGQNLDDSVQTALFTLLENEIIHAVAEAKNDDGIDGNELFTAISQTFIPAIAQTEAGAHAANYMQAECLALHLGAQEP